MVQSDQDEKFAGTYRKLFDTIERGVEQCSTDRLQTLIEEKKDQLKLGLEAFGEPSSHSRSKVMSGTSVTVEGKTIKLEQREKDLIITLSDILNLNELQCASLWEAYRQANKDSLSRYSNEQSYSDNVQLKMNVVFFYFEDRISLLECIGSLQRISLDQDHPYTSIAKDTITKLRQENNATSFVQRLFAQYSKLIRSNVPNRNNAFPGWSLIWAKQTLKEQKALLEIIFLFSLTDSFSPKFILAVVQEFEADCFGYLQAFGYVLDEEGISLRVSVTHICTLLAVNLVVPATLAVDQVKLDPSAAGQELIDSPDYIAKLNQVVAHLGDRQEHAVFLLAWSFFLTCVDVAVNDENTPLPSNYNEIVQLLEGKQRIDSSVLIDRPSVSGTEFDSSLNRSISIKQGANLDRIVLGRSLKLNAFDNAISILECEICSEEDVNCFGYRSVMRNLLNAFLSVTRPNFIPIDSYTSLINAFCLLYKNQSDLCEMFWTEDFDAQNTSSLLATARSRFPVFFTDFIELLSALTGAPADDLEEYDGSSSAKQVFEYLCNIPYIAVVLAPSVDITAKDENGEVVIYAHGPIVVTQQLESIASIVIPEGNRGLLLNTAEDERVVQYGLPYSGWHMLTTVLAGFVSDFKASNVDIQDQDKHLQGKNPESIECILNLIHNVLSSNPKLAPTLIQHIESVAGKTNGTPVLISVLCSILNTSSTMHPCPISILTMALKCLTLLIPFYSNDVWGYLKFAPILPTANPRIHLATLSSKPNPASQIQEIVSKVECTLGRYQLLLAFLDMVQGLVHDIQRSWWANESATVPNRQYQVEVLYICLHYLMSEVFPSYAQWRYKRLSDRFLIGTKIISIFIDITTSFKEPCTSNNKLSLNGIREGIFSNFLYEGGIYHIAPLVDTISEGAKTANALYKLNHPKEAQRIEKLTEMTFIFVEILLEHRLQQINAGTALAESTLERLLLERSGSSNSSDFLLRVARHIHYRHNITLPTHATKVLTLLCRTTSAWTNVPNFVQYLGSTDQVHAIIRTYLQIAKDHFQNETLLTSIWRLMTALMETQPSLAILFLDCGDFIMPSPKSAVRLLNGQTQPASSTTSATPVAESAIRAATDVLGHWEALSVEKPSVLSNILRFLATFWKTAFDHYALVERARVDNALWDVLGKVLLNPNNDIDTSGADIQSADLLDTDSTTTRHDLNVRRLCCLNLSKAFVMRIMAYEIHLSAGRGPSTSATERLPAGLKNLLNKLGESSKLAALRSAFVKNDFDPSTVRAAETSAEHLLQMIGIQTTAALLFKMPRVGDGDDDETAGEARRYGNNYLYDFSVANEKVQSLYKDISSKYDYITEENLIVTPEVQAVLDLKEGCNTFLQSVLLVNYNSSIVDTQIILLGSFKTFVETASRRVADLIWANKSAGAGADALYNFLNGLIDDARQETRDDGVTLTSYSILIQTIRNLTEDWISMNSAVVTGVAITAKQDYTSKTYQLLSALCGLLDRENYALFNSICDHTAIRFHRPLLESIMLCLRTLSGNVEYIASNGAQLENCLSGLLSVVCSSFHVLVIKANSYSVEGSPVSEEVKENCIKDVTVVISLLQELINSKYTLSQDIWLGIFEKSHTIHSLLSLFNSGVALVVKEVDSQSSNANGIYNISITPYAESALYFLLALSNIPKAATALVSQCVFESLFQNVLTPRLQRGELDLFIRFGNSNSNSNKNAPAYVERNPLHFIWCQMLGIVNNLMRTIGSEGAVLLSAVNFMQMYGPQIGTAFNNANGANDSIFGLTPSESLSSPLLEEIERINMIFFNISKYLDRLPNIANNLFVSFKDCSLFLLQRYLYFFTHPSHMQAQLYPVDNVERQQAHTFVSTAKEQQRTSHLMRKTLESILTITHTMLTTLIILTNTDIVLTAADVEWPFGNTIIYPEMRVTTGESASFGTLMECISNCMEKVTQWQQEDDYPVQPLLEVIKDCALLLTTQAALWIAKPNISDEMRVEIAQENVTDIMECMNKVSTSLAKLQESNSKFNVKSKLKLIQLLKSFLAARYYEQ